MRQETRRKLDRLIWRQWLRRGAVFLAISACAGVAIFINYGVSIEAQNHLRSWLALAQLPLMLAMAVLCLPGVRRRMNKGSNNHEEADAGYSNFPRQFEPLAIMRQVDEKSPVHKDEPGAE
jgi:hypothetical protein